MVGHMVPDVTFSQLCDEFYKGGMSMVKVKSMGFVNSCRRESGGGSG